jgi:hypothetical protein
MGRSRRWSFSDGFFGSRRMDYQAFTNDSLTVMYETIRGVLDR